MATYGYVRCSSADQNEVRQMITMNEQNIPLSHIFVDKVSGKDFLRPAYKTLVEKLVPGDLIYISSIARLGRGIILEK